MKKVQEEKFNHKVIIECSGINFIDGMGAAALQQVNRIFSEGTHRNSAFHKSSFFFFIHEFANIVLLF